MQSWGGELAPSVGFRELQHIDLPTTTTKRRPAKLVLNALLMTAVTYYLRLPTAVAKNCMYAAVCNCRNPLQTVLR